MSIEGFKHKGLSELFYNGRTTRVAPAKHKKIIELLDILDAAVSVKDLQGVSDFHELKGNRKGTFSLHVNGNWCITFKFKNGEVTDLNFEDYH